MRASTQRSEEGTYDSLTEGAIPDTKANRLSAHDNTHLQKRVSLPEHPPAFPRT